ncbi:MAG: M56 family metallopeptidase [Limisphaerales bacterium]
MNSFIETANQWGGQFLAFAWPMLWQSSLLITLVFALDLLLARKIRAAIRYGLWLAVLLKLLLPPALALPTGAAWWLFRSAPAATAPAAAKYVVTTGAIAPPADFVPETPLLAPKPKLDGAGWTLLASITVSAGLLLWLAFRWRQVASQVRNAAASEELSGALQAARQMAGLRVRARLKIVDGGMSPAVCGLFHPVILLPRTLAEKLPARQLRAVLLHEMFHLRRKDVWVNCAQALLQIFYWWHPLLWLANARIRRLREEAVDDAVMLALRDEAEIYAPTLLEVARLAFHRPLMSLGLVGIMESRSALRRRIERLLNFRAPRKAGLTLLSLCGIFAFSAVALPMGQAPVAASDSIPADAAVVEKTLTVKVDPEVFIRNVKAQANRTLGTETNHYSEILLDILRNEGVDCNPPHGIRFNSKTGELTMRNTPGQLDAFQQVIEQLNRPDGKCDLPLPIQRKIILIESRYFWVQSADFKKLTGDLQAYSGGHGNAPWWSVSPANFGEFDQRIKSLHLKSFAAPRVQTSSGTKADFFSGTVTNGVELNGVELNCVPRVIQGGIELVFRTEIVGDPAGKNQTLVGPNLYQIHGTVGAEDHGEIVVRAENPDDSSTNLVMVMGLQVVTNPGTSNLQEGLQRKTNESDDYANPSAKRIDPAAGMNPAATNLESRGFKVDPNTFVRALQTASGLRTTNVSTMAESLFNKVGVDLTAPGRSITFNDKLGLLWVTATPSELDTIKGTIVALNNIPPQIHIKARFIEVEQDNNASGFDWYLGSSTNGPVANGRGMPSPVVPVSAANPSVRFPVTGILSTSNTKIVIHALESNPGTEILAEPEVVTLSARQTQMRATDVLTVLTGINPLALKPPGVSSNELFLKEQVASGPVIDVVPCVLADGYTLNLNTTASLTEFLGYNQPTNSVTVYINGKKQTVSVPLPKFRTTKMSALVNLYDNQTLVLSGPVVSVIQTIKDQVPLLDDLPLIGRLFRSQTETSVKKNLMVFMTATMVDPAGNRVRTDDELRFVSSSIPTQPH